MSDEFSDSNPEPSFHKFDSLTQPVQQSRFVVVPESQDFIATVQPLVLPKIPKLAFDITITIR